MFAGTLNEFIDILQPIVVKNDFGEQKTVYEKKYSTRARLMHRGGNRVNENGDMTYNYTKQIQIRDKAPIKEYDIVVWNDKQYRILEIEPDKKAMALIITLDLINE